MDASLDRARSDRINFARHVSNIVYIQWMEIGRLKLLEAVGMPVHRADVPGFMPILIETQIVYKRSLYIHDTVRTEVWLSELSKASAWIEFRFYYDSGTLVASGRQRGVFVSTESSRPVRIPPDQMGAFERFLHTNDPDADSGDHYNPP